MGTPKYSKSIFIFALQKFYLDHTLKNSTFSCGATKDELKLEDFHGGVSFHIQQAGYKKTAGFTSTGIFEIT